MMNEKNVVAIAVTPEIANRVEREMVRQAFVAEIISWHKRVRVAGFSLEIVGTPKAEKTMFGNTIQMPADYFINSKTNQYNMHVDY